MEESTVNNKREISDAKRRSTLAAKRAAEKQRQAIVSLGLKSLEKSSSKKLVFKSDSEDEPLVVSKRLRLFDEDGSDDVNDQGITEGPSGVDEDSIVNRHFGKKGAKLAKLEAKFGHDSRFRMDEKFMDSDQEEEEQDTTEKEAHLAILSKVLGKTVKSKKSSARKAPGFRRFDPDNELHLQWVGSMKQKEAEEANNTLKKAEGDVGSLEEEQINNESKVVEGHFFEMNEGFAQSLKKKMAEGGDTKDDGFSFLKSIGRESAIGSVTTKDRLDVDVPPTEIKEKQSEEFGDKNTRHKEDVNLISSAVSIPTLFFLNDCDNEVVKVLKCFHRKRPIEDIRKKWSVVRKGIIKLYKKQRKNALKAAKSEQQGECNYRKDKSAKT